MPVVTLLLLLTTGSAAIAQHGAVQAARAADTSIADAAQYAEQKQYDKAVEAYLEAIRLNPTSVVAHLGLGTTYQNMGRPADAVEPLRTAVRLEPQNPLAPIPSSSAAARPRCSSPTKFSV